MCRTTELISESYRGMIQKNNNESLKKFDVLTFYYKKIKEMGKYRQKALPAKSIVLRVRKEPGLGLLPISKATLVRAG